MDPLHVIVPFIACFVAGGVNALAGGGTVISYPGFLSTGLNSITANATNAAALVPGSVGSAVAYRDDLRENARTFLILLVPTIIGSLVGAFVVARSSDEVFRRVVPFLVLGATLLFAFRQQFNGLLKDLAGAAAGGHDGAITPGGYAVGGALQFMIALYGGYFGAGIGILMLSSLSIIGMKDMHKMNSIKAALAAFINGTAVVFFTLDGKINWPFALIGAAGALLGGYVLARYAKRIPQRAIRAFVVAFGCVAAAWLFLRGWGLLAV